MRQDPRQALRLATREVHEALHHHKRVSRLLSPDISEREYAALLRAYRGFWRGLELRRASLDCWQDYSLANLVVRLDSDLAQMSENNESGEPADFEWITGRPACLGALYVAMGSRAGNTMIERHLAKVIPDVPRSYLRAAVPKEQWRSLLGSVNEYSVGEQGFDHIVHGAKETFLAFDDWVTRVCAERPEHRFH